MENSEQPGFQDELVPHRDGPAEKPSTMVCATMTELVNVAATASLPVRVSVEGEIRADGGGLHLVLPASGAAPDSFASVRLTHRAAPTHLPQAVQVRVSGLLALDPSGSVVLRADASDPTGTGGCLTVWLDRQKRKLRNVRPQEDRGGRRGLHALVRGSSERRIVWLGRERLKSFRDVIGDSSVLRKSISCRECPVQGEGAAPAIIAALGSLRPEDCDLAIVARGGGGLTDLALFDRADVCKAVADCRVPVLVAVGHFVDDVLATSYSAFRFAVPADIREVLTAAAEGRPMPKTKTELKQENTDLAHDVATLQRALTILDAGRREMKDERIRTGQRLVALEGRITAQRSELEETHRRANAWWTRLVDGHAERVRAQGQWRAISLAIAAGAIQLMQLVPGTSWSPLHLALGAALVGIAITLRLLNRPQPLRLNSGGRLSPDAIATILTARTSWGLRRRIERFNQSNKAC